MSFNVVTYSPSDVILLVGGYQVVGWTGISISKNTPSYQNVKGIRGKNTRVRNRDNSFTIQVTLLQTSMANSVFSEIVRQDLIYNTGRLEVSVNHTQGKFSIGSDRAFIEDYTSTNYTDGMENRIWTIHCQNVVDVTVGGQQAGLMDLFSGAYDKIGKTLGDIKDSASSLF